MIFSDEKKFNLDGPDGFSGYWRDLRRELKYFSTRNFGGGSLMVWLGFCATGKLNLAFTSCKMKSSEYIDVLKLCLIPFKNKYRRKKFVFQQDKANIHTSNDTKAWFEAKKIEQMWWPARSPDLNPVENIWEIIVRRIYADQKQYNSVAELKVAVSECWEDMDPKVLENLVGSMPKRIYQVIECKGGPIEY